MTGDSRGKGSEMNAKTDGEGRTRSRTWIVWLAVFGGIILVMLFKDRLESGSGEISQHKFEELVDSDQIVQATINYDPQNPALNEVVGRYYKLEKDARVEVPFRAKVRLTGSLE